MDILLSLIGDYYGLDWLTLLFGLTGTYCFSSRLMKPGFILCIIACCFGFAAAIMAEQMGFVAYNVLLILINIRGLRHGDRRVNSQQTEAPKPSVDVTSAPVQ